MFKTVLCSTLALVAGSAVVVMADAKDDVTAAATKLTDASNYSWKQATEAGGGGGGRGPGPVEGKTEKGGFTVLNVTFGQNDRQIVIKGDKVAMQNQDGEWQTAAEMAAAQQNQQPDANAGNGGRRRGRGRGGMGAMYTNYKLPAEVASEMASKAKSLTAADGAISGELSEDAAKAELMGGGRGGRRGGGNGGNAGAGAGNGPEISNAKATVKFWVKDGVLAKYESHVTGTVSFGGNDRDVDRTTTVEIANVGSTKVEVPDGAKKKFE